MNFKVLYLLHATIMGGATISFLNLVEGLSKKGVEIVVLIPRHDSAFEEQISKIGGRCYVVPMVVSIYPKLCKTSFILFISYPYFFLKFLFQKRTSKKYISEIIRKEQPSIIHTNVGVLHEGFKVARKNNIPHIWHLREYQDKDFGMNIYPSKCLFKKMLRQSYVVAITEDIKRYFNLTNSNKAHTIYNGIFSESCVYQQYPKEHFFLCASRISPEKGHEETIKVFAEFQKKYSDYRLVILGFGEESYMKYLRKLSEDLGCSGSIDWVGFTNDVASYMKRAQALIVNSKFEGFGRMTAEACFCSCLVIGRNTGGTKEILDYTGGYSIDSEGSLLDAMYSIADLDLKEYKNKAQMAQKKAISMYSIESNVKKTYDLYCQIL